MGREFESRWAYVNNENGYARLVLFIPGNKNNEPILVWCTTHGGPKGIVCSCP